MSAHHEDTEQKIIFEWAGYHPHLRWLMAIPNGGNRDPREAARLKAQGVKAGVADMFLPIPNGEHCGLWVELKRRQQDGPSRTSPKQRLFLADMADKNYHTAICYGADDAIRVIKEYCDTIKF